MARSLVGGEISQRNDGDDENPVVGGLPAQLREHSFGAGISHQPTLPTQRRLPPGSSELPVRASG